MTVCYYGRVRRGPDERRRSHVELSKETVEALKSLINIQAMDGRYPVPDEYHRLNSALKSDLARAKHRDEEPAPEGPAPETGECPHYFVGSDKSLPPSCCLASDVAAVPCRVLRRTEFVESRQDCWLRALAAERDVLRKLAETRKHEREGYRKAAGDAQRERDALRERVQRLEVSRSGTEGQLAIATQSIRVLQSRLADAEKRAESAISPDVLEALRARSNQLAAIKKLLNVAPGQPAYEAVRGLLKRAEEAEAAQRGCFRLPKTVHGVIHGPDVWVGILRNEAELARVREDVIAAEDLDALASFIERGSEGGEPKEGGDA